MTTFGKEVTIDERGLVLRDGLGDEIANLISPATLWSTEPFSVAAPRFWDSSLGSPN
jgi:hypothetical protein